MFYLLLLKGSRYDEAINIFFINDRSFAISTYTQIDHLYNLYSSEKYRPSLVSVSWVESMLQLEF